MWNWHWGVNVTLSKQPSKQPKNWLCFCEAVCGWQRAVFFFSLQSTVCPGLQIYSAFQLSNNITLLFNGCGVFCVCLSQFQNYSLESKSLCGIRCHYTATMWHKFASPASLREKKKIIGLIIFHLCGILHSLFYTTTASMSPVTWEAELCLHRLTVAPWKTPVFDVTTMPHQPPVLGIEHGRLSRGCLSAKWLLAHWLSRRGGEKGSGKREQVQLEKKWGGKEEGGKKVDWEQKKARTAEWRHGEGEKEKEIKKKESGSVWSLPLLAPLAGSCCRWLQKSARQSRPPLLAIRDHSSGCLLASLQIPQKYPLITTVGHRLFTKWI